MKGKDKALRVTMTVDFYIKMLDDETTDINGWTVEEVVEEIQGPLTRHKEREAYR